MVRLSLLSNRSTYKWAEACQKEAEKAVFFGASTERSNTIFDGKIFGNKYYV